MWEGCGSKYSRTVDHVYVQLKAKQCGCITHSHDYMHKYIHVHGNKQSYMNEQHV